MNETNPPSFTTAQWTDAFSTIPIRHDGETWVNYVQRAADYLTPEPYKLTIDEVVWIGVGLHPYDWYLIVWDGKWKDTNSKIEVVKPLTLTQHGPHVRAQQQFISDLVGAEIIDHKMVRPVAEQLLKSHRIEE